MSNMNMRKTSKIYLIIFLLWSLLPTQKVSAQTVNDNYVKTYKALKAIAGDLSIVNDKSQVQESIEYYDGLGRPLQSIARQGSRMGYDLVTLWVYDSYGRKATSYLPYASTATDGNIKSSPLADQTLFYQNQFGVTDGSLAFSVQAFENSELQRVLKISSPGAAWQPDLDVYSMVNNTVKKRYEFNGPSEVYLFTYETSTGLAKLDPNPALQYYLPNQLYANKTYDEHNNEVIEYTDKEGRTVCKKVYVKTEGSIRRYASTHYVYDDFGSLMIVLPPETLKVINPLY
jgi:hypothetical protein